jgi:glyoxylase-like metal-dependent hydrolase (beta-lactamase superfamily II)
MKARTLFNFLSHFEDIIMLGETHIPAFLYCGAQPILFDPGVSAFGPFYLEKIRELIAEPESLLLALTHAHFDHCGAVPYLLKKIPGMKVAASTMAAEILQRPNAIKLIHRLNAEYEQEMKNQIGDEDVSFDSIVVDFRLQGEVELDLGERNYCKIIETPGHTKDSLSYYFPNSRLVMVGEAAGVFENGFIHSPFLTNPEDYINSLEKLYTLKPEVLCVAHNGILVGREVPLFLSLSLEAAMSYRNMIEEYLNEYNGDHEKIVQKITAQEYDSQSGHIQKREPFILNLKAKVKAVAKLRE